jgi:Zn finger protein HypA/HybF involved in hydrogenase expression
MDIKQFILDNIRGIRVIEETYELKFDTEKDGFDFENDYVDKDTVDFYFLCLECEEEFEDLDEVVEHIPNCESEELDLDDDEEIAEEEEEKKEIDV